MRLQFVRYPVDGSKRSFIVSRLFLSNGSLCVTFYVNTFRIISVWNKTFKIGCLGVLPYTLVRVASGCTKQERGYSRFYAIAFFFISVIRFPGKFAYRTKTSFDAKTTVNSFPCCSLV